MSWARGISEFGAVVVIAYYPMIAATMIFYRFNTGGLKESQPIAVLLILLCFVIFLFLRLISRKSENMIRVKDISNNWGEFELKNVSLEVKQGEYFVILGPTGSGKHCYLNLS